MSNIRACRCCSGDSSRRRGAQPPVSYYQTTMRPSPPTPATLTHLRSSNAAAMSIVSASVGITVGAIWLSLQASIWWWAAGQILLALALVQWFAVLHECGHETLFRGKRSQCHRRAGGRLLLHHPVLQLEAGARAPPQVDRLAGRRSDDGRARAARAADGRARARERLLEVLDSAVLGALSREQLLELAAASRVIREI